MLNSRNYLLMGAGVILVAFFTMVVGLTVQRATSLQTTAPGSEAAGSITSSAIPGRLKVATSGSCSGLFVRITGPTLSGSTFVQTVPADNLGVWASKSTTAGSYTVQLLDSSKKVVKTYKTSVIAGQTATVHVNCGGSGGGTGGTSGTGGTGWQHFDQSNSKFSYFTSPACWFTNTVGGTTYRQANHKSPTLPQCGPTNTQWVKFDTTGSGVQFDQIKVGYAQWQYGALIPVTLDGNSLGQFDTKGLQAGPDRALQSWTSTTFSCGEHEVDMHIDTSGRSGASTLDLAFVEVHICSGGTSGGGGTGGTGVCTNPSQTHLGCLSGTCTRLVGAGQNADGCTSVGTSCSTGGGGGAGGNGQTCTDADKCWGNTGSDGTCYDCDGNGVINILDFSCFAEHWQENISGSKPAACGQ